jgi:hypothetical protein
MVLEIGIILVLATVIVFGFRQLYVIASEMRVSARAARMKEAIDWRRPEERRQPPKSRMSQFLNF